MNFENLCQVCQEKTAPYKCPKCNIRYCTLNCYRDRFHGDCSEKFQEKQLLDTFEVDDEAQDQDTMSDTTNNFVRERIAEIFKRKLDEKDFHNDEDDENVDEFLNEVISRIKEDERVDPDGDNEDEEAEARVISDEEEPLPDLPDDFEESDENTKQLWDCLNVEEQQQFKSMLKDGRISHLLNDYKPWKPWWLFIAPSPVLISDVNENSEERLKLPDDVPKINSPIVGLASLTSILPHPLVRFDLFEILFGYVLITVRYRSEFPSYLDEAGNELIYIASKQFNQSTSIDSIHERILSLRQYLQEQPNLFRISEQFFINIVSDVRKIVHGPYPRSRTSNEFVLAALSDLKNFIVKIQTEKPNEKSSTLANRNVFHLQKETVKRKMLPSKSSKLCQATKSKSKSKVIEKISRKLDYLLSWSVTYADRLPILEQELEIIYAQVLQQLTEYEKEKSHIEKHMKDLRFQKSNKIEEL